MPSHKQSTKGKPTAHYKHLHFYTKWLNTFVQVRQKYCNPCCACINCLSPHSPGLDQLLLISGDEPLGFHHSKWQRAEECLNSIGTDTIMTQKNTNLLDVDDHKFLHGFLCMHRFDLIEINHEYQTLGIHYMSSLCSAKFYMCKANFTIQSLGSNPFLSSRHHATRHGATGQCRLFMNPSSCNTG